MRETLVTSPAAFFTCNSFSVLPSEPGAPLSQRGISFGNSAANSATGRSNVARISFEFIESDDFQTGVAASTQVVAVVDGYLAFATSTAYTWRSPCMLLRKTSHLPSGVKVTLGSRL